MILNGRWGAERGSSFASPADHARDFEPVLPSVFDTAVGKIVRSPPGDTENVCRVGSFARAIFGGAARSHFTLRQVKDAGALPALRHLRERAAAGLFYIVAVGGDGQNVEVEGT